MNLKRNSWFWIGVAYVLFWTLVGLWNVYSQSWYIVQYKWSDPFMLGVVFSTQFILGFWAGRDSKE